MGADFATDNFEDHIVILEEPTRVRSYSQPATVWRYHEAL